MPPTTFHQPGQKTTLHQPAERREQTPGSHTTLRLPGLKTTVHQSDRKTRVALNHLGFDRRLTVEQRERGEETYAAADYKRPVKHLVAAGLFVVLAFAVMGLYGKTAMRQHAALSRWASVKKPEGQSSSRPRKMHSPAFWEVMVAFNLEHGDSVEDFSAIIGEPEQSESVTWYLYMKQGINDRTNKPTWVLKNPKDFVMPGHVRELHAKRYWWKGDYYYWPRPKGE